MKTENSIKWFHAIGGSGKTTANVCKMFKDMGWFVTASDMQFLPPASTIIEDAGIPHVEGYHYSHLTKDFWKDSAPENVSEQPDLCLIMEFLTTSNKEYRYAKLHNIPVLPFSQILGEYLVKENSIVVIGTAGKTTTTALIALTLRDLGLKPNYMIGAEVNGLEESLYNSDLNTPRPSTALGAPLSRGDSQDWSVIEGDEYHNPEISGGAKFLFFKPKYLVITNIGWEHQDVFATKESYVAEFRKAVELVPADGLIVAKASDESIDEVVKGAKCKVIRYEAIKSGHPELVSGSQEMLKQVQHDNTSDYQITKNVEGYSILDASGNILLEGATSLLGDYNLENICATFALLNEFYALQKLPVTNYQLLTESFAKTIASFRGAKKRLEKLYEDDHLTVIDDFGVAPDRAKRSLQTLKEHYPNHKIIAVFEPNAASRFKDEKQFNEMYKGVFDNANEVIIPELSTFDSSLATSDEMTSRLNDLDVSTKQLSNDKLVEELTQNSKLKTQNFLIVFFSSYRLTEIAQNLVDVIRKM